VPGRLRPRRALGGNARCQPTSAKSPNLEIFTEQPHPKNVQHTGNHNRGMQCLLSRTASLAPFPRPPSVPACLRAFVPLHFGPPPFPLKKDSQRPRFGLAFFSQTTPPTPQPPATPQLAPSPPQNRAAHTFFSSVLAPALPATHRSCARLSNPQRPPAPRVTLRELSKSATNATNAQFAPIRAIPPATARATPLSTPRNHWPCPPVSACDTAMPTTVKGSSR